MSDHVAESRRTQLVSTYGVGALFPAQDQSFMILGTDEWEDKKYREIPEPRLARSLGVQTFRLPPSGSKNRHDVPVIRFPELHHCPVCNRLDYHHKFCQWGENRCERDLRTLVPSRFVVSCTNGHIDEFPYRQWLHGQGALTGNHELKLTTRGQSSSLKDLVLSCSCGIPAKSMSGSFGANSLAGVTKCFGRRPWLRGAENEECDQVPRTMQRGSSSVWFPSVRSAISIPPWSDKVQKVVAKFWPLLESMSADAIRASAGNLVKGALPNASVDEFVNAVLERKGVLDGTTTIGELELREDEFKALYVGHPEESPQDQFVAHVRDVPDEAESYIDRLCEVSRLREVRALHGFTRVVSPDSEDAQAGHSAALSREKKFWLPAIEVLGEGIFINFDGTVIGEWAAEDFARGRIATLQEALDTRAALRGVGADTLTAKEVLLHSTAHLLINELSLDAGYPAASLRERLYVEKKQAGVLIYTASADSAGSLGGLSAQADGERLWGVLRSAVERAAWCSTDPVCVETRAGGKDALNMAACHACLLLPETSCERANILLDRALVVGTPDEPGAGFFASLLEV